MNILNATALPVMRIQFDAILMPHRELLFRITLKGPSAGRIPGPYLERVEQVQFPLQDCCDAGLLWRPEVQDLLRGMGNPERDLRAPREELYQRLVSLMPLRKLSGAVRFALKSRTTWRDQQPLS